MPLHWLLCPALFVVLSILFTLAGYQKDFWISIICIAFLALYLIMNYKGVELIKAISRSAFLPIWLIVFTTLAHVDFLNFGEIALVAVFLYYVGIGH